MRLPHITIIENSAEISFMNYSNIIQASYPCINYTNVDGEFYRNDYGDKFWLWSKKLPVPLRAQSYCRHGHNSMSHNVYSVI